MRILKKWLVELLNKFFNLIFRNETLKNVAQKSLIDLDEKKLGDLLIYRRRFQLNTKIAKELSYQVRNGVFKGLKISPHRFWSETDLAGMLLGYYEIEVLNFFEKLMKERITLQNFINIGAAEGYYACGVAKLFPESNIFAFEIEKESQEIISENARLNNVKNINVLGKFDKTSFETLNFQSLLGNNFNNTLILSDIEGAEYEIFTEEVLKRISESFLIIEIHGFTAEMEARRLDFIKTVSNIFETKIVQTGDRNPLQYPELAELDDVDRWLLVAEGRGHQGGMYILAKPKNKEDLELF